MGEVYLRTRVKLIEEIVGDDSKGINLHLEANKIKDCLDKTTQSVRSIGVFLDGYDYNKYLLNINDHNNSLSIKDKLTFIQEYEEDLEILDNNLRKIELLHNNDADGSTNLDSLLDMTTTIEDIKTNIHNLNNDLIQQEKRFYNLLIRYNNQVDSISTTFIDIHHQLLNLELNLTKL